MHKCIKFKCVNKTQTIPNTNGWFFFGGGSPRKSVSRASASSSELNKLFWIFLCQCWGLLVVVCGFFFRHMLAPGDLACHTFRSVADVPVILRKIQTSQLFTGFCSLQSSSKMLQLVAFCPPFCSRFLPSFLFRLFSLDGFL